jgi:hypothetical protein
LLRRFLIRAQQTDKNQTMFESRSKSTAGSSAQQAAALPRRDYFVLPLLSFLTVLFMFVVTETVSRLIWPELKISSCTIEDPIGGDRFKPNCVVRAKIAEGPWTTYQYNECGYRSATSCGPKSYGTIRIGILGSSMGQALHIPYDEAFFSIASGELGRRCGRPIDVQNLGVPNSSPIYAYRRVPEILALKPDVVLYLLAPFDVEQQILPAELAERNDPLRVSSTSPVKVTVSPLNRLERTLIQSRTVLMAQHFIFQDQETFIRTYLLYGDKADFLRQPFTPAWQQRFANLDLIIGDMAEKLRAARVPLIVIPVPSRAEAALLSSGEWPPHVDPFAFGREIESIASRHGVGFVDLMEPFSRIPNSENLYYVVDGHPTVEGHKVIAKELLQKLEDGSVPGFSSCVLQQSAEGRH